MLKLVQQDVILSKMHNARFLIPVLGSALAVSALELCPTPVIVQPVVVVDHSPVWVNSYFPQDTSLLVSGVTVAITNCPTSISGVITGTSINSATLTK